MKKCTNDVKKEVKEEVTEAGPHHTPPSEPQPRDRKTDQRGNRPDPSRTHRHTVRAPPGNAVCDARSVVTANAERREGARVPLRRERCQQAAQCSARNCLRRSLACSRAQPM